MPRISSSTPSTRPWTLAAGLLINVTSDKVVRLLPPLVIGADEAREVVRRLAPLVRAFLERP